MRIRIIHSEETQRDGSIGPEELYITEDFDSPAIDFVAPGWTVHSDTTAELESAPGFPLEHSFRKAD